MLRRLVTIAATTAMLGGGIALSASAASAGEYPGPEPAPVTSYQFPGQPFQFAGCTTQDRREELRLLLEQRFGQLDRAQRLELRYLERVCGGLEVPQPVVYTQPVYNGQPGVYGQH